MNKVGVKAARNQVNEEGFKVHTTDPGSSKNKTQLASILEQNSLEQFMQFAEMSQKQFTAERNQGQQLISGNTVIPVSTTEDGMLNYKNTMNKFLDNQSIINPQYKAMKIPRRPAWNKEMSAQEIN